MDFKEYIEEQSRTAWLKLLPRVMPWVAKCLGRKEEDIEKETGLIHRDVAKIGENTDTEIVKINEMNEIEICKIADLRLIELKKVLKNPNPKLDNLHKQVKNKIK
mgnify:CR=1 FL=1